jgi:hypothetical protein
VQPLWKSVWRLEKKKKEKKEAKPEIPYDPAILHFQRNAKYAIDICTPMILCHYSQ